MNLTTLLADESTRGGPINAVVGIGLFIIALAIGSAVLALWDRWM